jgi:hypothetical protein
MDNKAFLHMINSEEYIKLYDYYNQKTFMDILGVSRRENEHSNFLAWLFNPSENHGMDDYPLKKLLQTIAFRRKKDDNYNSVEPKNLLNKKYDKYIDDFIYDVLSCYLSISSRPAISAERRPPYSSIPQRLS